MSTFVKTSLAVGWLVTASTAAAQECIGWIERNPDGGPGAALFEPMVYDTARQQCVLFDGGFKTDGVTWGWDGSEWTMLATGGPESFNGFGTAFDSGRSVVVLFGGNLSDAPSDSTWEWDGQIWEYRQVNARPDGRSGHTMVYDSKRGVTVLYGGSYLDDFDSFFYGDTWEWDGTNWTKVAVDGPSPRFNHAMAYDESRGVTVVYGGGGPGGPFGDTWEWDGNSWTERKVQGPGIRYRAAMVYDSDLHACILFGGSDGGQLKNDTWTWDGAVWTKLDTPDAPNPRADHAMAYDSARHAVVLFGGGVGNSYYDDTWEFTCTPCYPDFTGDGALDLFDFLAFVNAFNQANNNADCDQNGDLDLFDFLCFTNAFNAGC